MVNKLLRFAKFAVIAVVVLALAVLIVSRIHQPTTTRAFFWAERTWSEYWPLEKGRYALQKLEPEMCKLGILGPVRLEVEPHVSFLLDPRDVVPVTILRTGTWQPEIWDAVSPNLPEGGVFLDVGAHIGYFSMKAAAKVGKSGRVISFEPNPETLKLLRDNATVNNAGNITVEPIACTDHEQMLTLWAAPASNTGMSSLSKQNAEVSSEEPKPYTVRGRPIDDVVRELNLTRVDAIKIDVEGAEVFVLRGAVETMKRFHPKLVIEVLPEELASFHTSADDLTSLIKNAGYNHSRRLTPHGDDWEWTQQ